MGVGDIVVRSTWLSRCVREERVLLVGTQESTVAYTNWKFGAQKTQYLRFISKILKTPNLKIIFTFKVVFSSIYNLFEFFEFFIFNNFL